MYHYLGNNKGIVKTNKGAKLYVNTKEKSISPHLITDGYWEPNITNFMWNHVKPGMQIVEIGANIGYYTTMMAGKIGEDGLVTAFEPNPAVFKLLKDNIEVNGLRPRVNLHELAVSNSTGEKFFTMLEDHVVSSSLLSPATLSMVEGGLYENESKGRVTVQTTDLDSLLPMNHVDFMKIDAEGYEWHIFDGMKELLKRNPKMTMLVEFVPEYLGHASENGATKLLQMITDLGYKLKYIDTTGQVKPISVTDALNKHYLELFLEK